MAVMLASSVALASRGLLASAVTTTASFKFLHVSCSSPGWGYEHRPHKRWECAHRANKHRDPANRKARNEKILKVPLPDFDFQRRLELNEVSPADRRTFMKRHGMLQGVPYSEKQVYISSTGAVLEQFVPPEGDGKASMLSKEGAKSSYDLVTKRGKSYIALRKIRKFEDGFDPRTFVETAQEIYEKAHKALADRDEEALHKYATEKAYPEMLMNVDRKTIRWQLVKSLEPPRVVQIRVQDIMTKSNLFAQVTVRFHTQQVLAVYDRFGRLIHGSPVVAKDVLEYVVFEKHIANVYGSWRLHAKIIPDWMEVKPAGILTHVLPAVKEEPEEPVNEKDTESDTKEDESEEGKEDSIYDRFGRIVGRGK